MRKEKRFWRGMRSPAARLDEQRVRPLLYLYLCLSFFGEFSGPLIDLVRHQIDPALPAYYAQSWLNVSLAMVWLLLMVLGIWMSTQMLLAALIGCSLLGGTVVVYMLGGVTGPLTIYYLVPALLGFFLFDARGVLLTVGATLASFSSLFWVEFEMGQVAPQFLRSNQLPIHAFITATGLLAVIGLVLVLVTAYRDQLLEQVEKNASIQAEMEAKEVFLARVSHELRTPITSLVGFAELLRQEARQDDGTLREGIYLNSLNLLTMINNLLDFRKVSQGHFVMEPRSMEVPRLVEDLRVMLQPGLVEKNLAFTLHSSPDPFPVLIIDPVGLERILVNLVSNAIKHTENGSIEIFLDFHAGMLELRVVDSGKGMDAESAARVFEPYYQAPGQKQGTGLGLALVKELVERAGGTVELFSALGEGTQVRVTLPAVVDGAKGRRGPRPLPIRSQPDPPPLAGEKKALEAGVATTKEDDKSDTTVAKPWLFVEDQHDIRTMIKLFLGNLGYRAVLCASWKEVSKVPLTDIERAYVDLRLPGVDGFVICRRLQEANPRMVVKAMTAQLPDGGLQDLREKGFGGILMKPFTLEQFRQELEE